MGTETGARSTGPREHDDEAHDAPLESARASSVTPDEASQELRRENEGLRYRLKAAEEVLEDLGDRSQKASSIALQNQQLMDEIESLKAAKQDVEKELAPWKNAAKTRPLPTVGGDTAEPRAEVSETGGNDGGRRAEGPTGLPASSVNSDAPALSGAWPLTPAGLTGTFSEMPFLEVVQMLATSRKTGLLAIKSGEKRGSRTGAVYFCEGRVIGCELMAAGGLMLDHEAFYAMVALSEGSFELISSAITFEPRMSTPVQGLLMEAARRLDEQTRGA